MEPLYPFYVKIVDGAVTLCIRDTYKCLLLCSLQEMYLNVSNPVIDSSIRELIRRSDHLDAFLQCLASLFRVRFL